MANEKKCKNCEYYRKDTVNYGECLLRPPSAFVDTIHAGHPDSWQRPVVWLDDFCGDFTAAKIVKKKPARKPNDDQLEMDL